MYKKFLLQLLLLLAWQCLTLPHHSLLHPTFKAVLPTFDILQELFLQASLNFHKELFGILIGLKPPTLATLKKLPTFTARKIWGVYMIILKKADAKPKVYVGSGTEHYDNQGVHARLRAYDNPDVYWSVLPQYVRRAMKDGYSITHKAAICWIPIPSPGKAPMYRTLFLVLEALFMAVFRATISSAVLYGCGLAKVSCWDGIDFEWDGACGHSPLREAPIGQFDLSEEEITRIAAVLKEKLKARKTHNARRRRMRPGVSEQENINAQKSRAKILAEAKYHCSTCNYTGGTPTELARHDKSRPHLEAVGAWDKAQAKATAKYFCDLCEIRVEKSSAWEKHLATKKHRARVRLDEKLQTGAKLTRSEKEMVRGAEARRNKLFYCQVCEYAGGNARDIDRHLESPIHARRVDLLEN